MVREPERGVDGRVAWRDVEGLVVVADSLVVKLQLPAGVPEVEERGLPGVELVGAEREHHHEMRTRVLCRLTNQRPAQTTDISNGAKGLGSEARAPRSHRSCS